ncbi:MAG: hypothetical protein K9M49_08105 [Candidatus Marinimicrobia bacterium]|nr:hypothetical protein [Candidatus Neomarinimicrobiota bacterium]MCF7850650.1 hypothetical protein [Candidatus Neomarinimicrobiota bacterium]MCF7905101.1 hypothetical protein [Candidatus Neomarinimicrobiota bacterium]
MDIKQVKYILNQPLNSDCPFIGFSAILIALLLAFLPANLLGQEDDFFGSADDDSLLFGEEFDLGGDDFSLDFEDEGAAEGGSDDPFGGDAAEDDFSFDFEDDEGSDDAVAEEDTSGLGDEWGFGSEGEDYESLITKTVEGEQGDVERNPGDHPLDLRKYTDGTIFENTGWTLSLYSPHFVGPELETWFSYIDLSVTADLPWHFTLYPVELTFSIDVSSFNFSNSYPAGGTFQGITIIPMAKAEFFGAEIELGTGLFYPTFGVLAGAGYSFQYHSLFASAGYRWNWVNNIDPIGPNWWLEPRFTLGLKLW